MQRNEQIAPARTFTNAENISFPFHSKYVLIGQKVLRTNFYSLITDWHICQANTVCTYMPRNK
jgi:hypothetical protein